MAKGCQELHALVRSTHFDRLPQIFFLNHDNRSCHSRITHLIASLNYDILTSFSFIRWFSVTMGTGIVSILIHNLPYNGTWLYWISVVLFASNVSIFIAFLILSILRYSIYPDIWRAMIRHPAQSLFLGTFPMGLATIINMIVFVCVPAWGAWTVQLVSAETTSRA